VKHCAKCHDAKTASEKGGKFVMTKDGALTRLSAEAVRDSIKKMMVGDMPQDHKVNDQEFTLIIAELLGLQSK
jgi:mono/diheme cytochrome c family protein